MDGTDFLPDKRQYAFDSCSPAALIRLVRVENGKIVFPGGVSYRLMVLPAMDAVTPELLSKIEELVRDGAVVVGSPPRRSPSLENYPDCDHRLRETAERVWGSLEWPREPVMHDHGKGKIFWGGELSPKPVRSDANPLEAQLYPSYEATVAVLNRTGVQPDFMSATGKVRYTHRSLPELGREVYFISNRTGQVVEDVCRFRDGSLRAELWDPVTGEMRVLRDVGRAPGGVELGVRLEPHQSFFIVFKKGDSPYDTRLELESENRTSEESEGELGWPEARVLFEGSAGETKEGRLEELRKNIDEGRANSAGLNARANERRMSGGEKQNQQTMVPFRSVISRNFPQPQTLMESAGSWKVWFDPKWGGPGEVVFEKLIDWTKHPADGIRYYSGTAVYSLDFDLPKGIKIARNDQLYLDLGEVHCLARVTLNGRELGIVWTSPPSVRLKSGLRKKGNRLEIGVANPWINRLIGDENEPWDGVAGGKWPEWLFKGEPRPTNCFTFTTHRFYKQGDPLLPSGLIGPVVIVKR